MYWSAAANCSIAGRTQVDVAPGSSLARTPRPRGEAWAAANRAPAGAEAQPQPGRPRRAQPGQRRRHRDEPGPPLGRAEAPPRAPAAAIECPSRRVRLQPQLVEQGDGAGRSTSRRTADAERLRQRRSRQVHGDRRVGEAQTTGASAGTRPWSRRGRGASRSGGPEPAANALSSPCFVFTRANPVARRRCGRSVAARKLIAEVEVVADCQPPRAEHLESSVTSVATQPNVEEVPSIYWLGWSCCLLVPPSHWTSGGSGNPGDSLI